MLREPYLDARHTRVHDGDQEVEEDGDGDQVVDVPHDQGRVPGNTFSATDNLWMARVEERP